jgi:SAM-dependent methyltransferase
MPANPWLASDVPRGASYDRRFDRLAAQGADVHGEADLVDSYGPCSVLDAGCGTGRVALELSRRGHRVAGVDVDPSMLAVAHRKAPELMWVDGDLADQTLDVGAPFDIIVLAGNVLIFVTPGSERQVIANMALHLVPGGRLIAGYSLVPGGFDLATHDACAAEAGLFLEDRWSTWDRRAFTPADAYAVSVHRLPD